MEIQNNPSNLGESANHVDQIDEIAGTSYIADNPRQQSVFDTIDMQAIQDSIIASITATQTRQFEDLEDLVKSQINITNKRTDNIVSVSIPKDVCKKKKQWRQKRRLT